MPEKALDQLLKSTVLHRYTPFTVRTKSELRKAILKARETGLAEEVQEAAEAVSCFAVNLAFLGFPEAAMSIAVPLQRLGSRHKTAIIQALKSLDNSPS